MNIDTIYTNLINNRDRIEAEITDRLTNHPDSDSSLALKAAIENRKFSDAGEQVKISVLDDSAIECFLYIQFYGYAHDRAGVDWSEATLRGWS